MKGGAGLVAAGAWIGPFLALALGGGLLQLAAGPAGFGALGIVIIAAVLAGVPAAMLASFRGAVAGPVGVASLAGAIGALALLADQGASLGLATIGGLTAAGLVALSVGLVAARINGISLLWPGIVGLAAALGCALAGPSGPGAALLALGLGATLAALPGTAAGALTGTRLRAGTAPTLAGIAIGLAVVAGPGTALLRDGPAAALALAPLVAMPGLALVAAMPGTPGLPPLRLATLLLLLQAMVVALALAAESAPVAAGLLRAEDLPLFRAALLGAAFLPVFASLLAVLLHRRAFGRATMAALLLALVSALAAVLEAGALLLAAPLLATALAAWMVARLASPLVAEETP